MKCVKKQFMQLRVRSISTKYGTLDVKEYDGIVKVVLNRPKKKNSFTWEMYNEVVDVLQKCGSDVNVKTLLLTGSGDFYTSGNDLSNFSVIKHPLTIAKEAKFSLNKFIGSFIDFPKPLICAVNGPAIGIGVTTLALCDRVFSSSTAYYRTPFGELGQWPEGCSSYFFPKLMGEEVANEVLWKGRKLSADEAKLFNLVHEVYSPDQVLQAAEAYCKKIALLSDSELRNERFILRDGLLDKLHRVNSEESEMLAKKLISPECFNALASFLESRNMRMQAAILRVANATGFLWRPRE